MSEPENKESVEWRDWYVRHCFGGLTVAIIKAAGSSNIKSLDVLRDFIEDIKNK